MMTYLCENREEKKSKIGKDLEELERANVQKRGKGRFGNEH